MPKAINKDDYLNRLSFSDHETVMGIVSRVSNTIRTAPLARLQRDQWLGVYAIGSRASGEENTKSDVDLLVAHNLRYTKGCMDTGLIPWKRDEDESWEAECRVGFDYVAVSAIDAVLTDFPKRKPRILGELPTEYQEGAVDRKVLARFVGPISGRSALDLAIFRGIRTANAPTVNSVEEFASTIDTDSTGISLPRVALFEWSPAEGINTDFNEVPSPVRHTVHF